MGIGLIVIGLICLVLMFQRWFWLLVFGIGSIASGLALLDRIIHFQILGALGYCFLMFICWKITSAIAKGYPPPKGNTAQEIHLPSKATLIKYTDSTGRAL